MGLNLLPLDTLGAIETRGVVTFGISLPWVSAAEGNAVTVKVIHEDDLKSLSPFEESVASAIW